MAKWNKIPGLFSHIALCGNDLICKKAFIAIDLKEFKLLIHD